jgi:hypothetical protein
VVYNYLPTNTTSGRMQPLNSRFGKVGNVRRFKMWGCIAYLHIPAAVRDFTLAKKAYGGYFVGFRWPMLDNDRVFVPSLDQVLKSAHVHFDVVTPLVRKFDLLLLIDPERRSAQDFQWLLDLVNEDDENQIRYVTTKVTTSRGFVVAYRAPFIGGKLGKEEQVPIHAKDVELLVRQQWQNRVPYMLVNNVLTEVLCVNALQGAPGVLKEGSD